MQKTPLLNDRGVPIIRAMYLRRHAKKVAGEEYGYWSLVESVRTAGGPRQRIVATIGKLPSLDREERVGWDEIGRILSGKSWPEPDLFHQVEEPPSWATVNVSGVKVERLRHFGDVYLGLLLWNRLGLAEFCRETIPAGREEIPWSIMAALLVLARFCAPSSELPPLFRYEDLPVDVELDRETFFMRVKSLREFVEKRLL